MSDAVIFGVVFVAFFLLRLVATTVFFFFILDEGRACPQCNGDTLRVQSPLLERLLPWFRSSWCPDCGWEGLLRISPSDGVQVPGATSTLTHSGQPPGSSKKSSK